MEPKTISLIVVAVGTVAVGAAAVGAVVAAASALASFFSKDDKKTTLDRSLTKRRGVKNYSYDEKDVLGKGGFGTVYKGRHDQTGKEVAIKVIHYRATDKEERELNILVVLKHENIVILLNACKSSEYLYLILELCDGCMSSMEGKVHGTELSDFIQQTASGLKYVHSHDIIHRDLKPANILYVDRKRRIYKIGDFGLSRMIEGTDYMTRCGTRGFMAPEIVKKNKVTYSCDIYSLGQTISVLNYGLLIGDVRDRDKFYTLIGSMTKDTPGERILLINVPANIPI